MLALNCLACNCISHIGQFNGVSLPRHFFSCSTSRSRNLTFSFCVCSLPQIFFSFFYYKQPAMVLLEILTTSLTGAARMIGGTLSCYCHLPHGISCTCVDCVIWETAHATTRLAVISHDSLFRPHLTHISMVSTLCLGVFSPLFPQIIQSCRLPFSAFLFSSSY